MKNPTQMQMEEQRLVENTLTKIELTRARCGVKRRTLETRGISAPVEPIGRFSDQAEVFSDAVKMGLHEDDLDTLLKIPATARATAPAPAAPASTSIREEVAVAEVTGLGIDTDYTALCQAHVAKHGLPDLARNPSAGRNFSAECQKSLGTRKDGKAPAVKKTTENQYPDYPQTPKLKGPNWTDMCRAVIEKNMAEAGAND